MEHTSKKLLQVVLDACEDKLAQEVVALDVASLTPVAEYFVITHGKTKSKYKRLSMLWKKRLKKRRLRSAQYRR